MAQPRFLFVARARARTDSWSRWQAGSRSPQPDILVEHLRPTAWVAWRLVGANNRELGRSPNTYIDLLACADSVSVLRRSIDGAQSTVAVDPSTGCWFWRLESVDGPIAAAGRAYQRQRECQYSLEQFQRATPAAAADVQTLIDIPDSEPSTTRLPIPRRSHEHFKPASEIPERTVS